ncbi:hypothetical protein SynBIOSE41_02468 [Synechococcus sp. BIOS-E4-1]|uniref:hypothetical protein n=1 Tax=Synechococcus sp. BIOS-E4-1 TaxID=1400864 RepID=UPI0016448D2C|nr:hypothetical protein [Synechococcus sp. BIOS-E4-1]QNI54968.1 hypothetical protein SynBIOSE41_02468 [Synechococcus sp. BIOS-E4-1]
MTASNTSKRKRGRPPKQKVFSAAELQARSTEFMKISQQRRQGAINYVEAEKVVSLMSDSSKVQNLTQDEVLALREEATKLWELLGYTEEYETERYKPVTEQLSDEEFLDTPSIDGQMSRKDWIEAHAFLKPKRKNARLPKSIRDIKQNKFDAYGLTDEKPEPIDHAAMEAELEKKLMDRACEERAEAKKQLGHVGKRLRQPAPQGRKHKVDTSKFWT